MFGGLTDMPRLSNYEQALAHLNDVKPIAGKGVNAGKRPLCDTANGRRKTQYSIRKKKHPAAASKQAIECVLYTTPVVTFVEDGTIYIDMSYPSNTTHAFISEILNGYRAYCSYRDGKTWLHCRGKDWWIPNGYGVTFKVVGESIEPVRPRLMDRYVVNRSKAKEVYARYAAFISHCLVISKVADPETIYKQKFDNQQPCAEYLLGSEPSDEWSGAVVHFLGNAVEHSREWDWGSGGGTKLDSYHLRAKKVKAKIHDYLKHKHAPEIFEVTKATAGVYTTCLNEEYIR